MTQSEDSRWSWMAASGAEASGDEWALLAALKSGEITPETMVWRRTWLDWLPACRVAELAHLLPPGAAQPALTPRRSENALRPPPRIIEAGAPNAPSSFGNFGQRPALGAPRPLGASRPPRAVQPTIDEEAPDPKGTLRPPGAVPPPPRAVAGGMAGSTPRTPPANATIALPNASPGLGQTALLGHNAVLGPRKPQPTLVGVGSGEGAPLPPPRPFNQTLRLGDPPRPAPGAPPPLGHTLPLGAGGVAPPLPPAAPYAAAEVLPSAPMMPPPAATTPYAPVAAVPYSPPSAPDAPPLMPPSRNHAVATPTGDGAGRVKRRASGPIWIACGAMVLLAAAAGGAAIFTKQRAESAPAPAESALPAAPLRPAPVPVIAGCRLSHPAARLAPDFYRRVVPAFALAPDGKHVAVGFAESKSKAVGVIVDPETLASELDFSEVTKATVSAVIPRFDAGKATFTVDSDRGALRGTRSLPGEKLSIALAGADLVEASGAEPRLLLKDAAPGKSTDPRVASSGDGHLVSFRRGGLQGDVAYTFLSSGGKPLGDLHALRSDESAMNGTPDAALDGERLLLAFAGRATNDEPWQVFLASGKKGGPTPPIARFQTPPGGLGGGSIAPSVAALPGGRWALSWTEGKTPQYEVRLQALEADLTPRGEPLLVSPKGANAGQASMFAMGSTLFSVFVQSTAGHDELWAATFRCE